MTHFPGNRPEPCGCEIDPGSGRRVVLICRPHRDEADAHKDPLRPAIDRAIDGDHRLCSLEPCTDCR